MKRRTLRGMTLIEVMVAITIMGIVATITFGGFLQTLTNKTRIEQQADESHLIRVAFERMVSEISMAYVSMHLNPSPSLQLMNTCFIGGRSGNGHRLDFTSFSHRRLYRDAHESDQNELSYFMMDHPDDPNRHVLVRREQNRVDDDPQTGGTIQILVDDVLDFQVEYFDPITAEWLDTWDTRQLTQQPNRLPMQVKLMLTVPDENRPDGRRTYATRAQPMITWALNHAIYNTN
ncbi:prepilin-type N-terminal cleavage/methylation domain-containing protein [bacterium AH-315-N03]|nr:prepilin-type N-terminal cleavage/methylation domain-containing protein [bacterium AH-315-N03]